MRLVFGVLGLLIVLAIVASLAKTQLQAVGASTEASTAAGVARPAPGGTPAQRSQQIQQRVADDLNQALQQGAARARDAQ